MYHLGAGLAGGGHFFVKNSDVAWVDWLYFFWPHSHVSYRASTDTVLAAFAIKLVGEHLENAMFIRSEYKNRKWLF